MRASRSLLRVIRSGRFRITCDRAFGQVIDGCAGARPHERGTWISQDLKAIYCDLHQQGFAHSIEAWLGDALVGGLYGVALGGAFFGESMFCLPGAGGSDASKVCLIALVQRLDAAGFDLLDCQYANSHMLSMGAVEIPQQEYLERLTRALAATPEPAWHPA